MRHHTSLNGRWQFAESIEADAPRAFPHTVTVPGFADMVQPPLAEVGVRSKIRRFFWYRREFTTPDAFNQLALIRIGKARYGLKAWLNGGLLGEHLHNFTATTFDASGLMKEPGQTNELILRIGADPSVLPDDVVWGHDFEKIQYLPGVYDEVRLILTGTPLIENLQVAPEIGNETAHIRVWLRGMDVPAGVTPLSWRVCEAGSGLEVAGGTVEAEANPADFSISLPDARPWTPESPFLYRLEVTTEGDRLSAVFGMRHFCFNPRTGRAELNGETLYLRGTNICIDRFAEDSARGTKLWDRDWVRRLYGRIKEMNWNSFRFCLGFPPEFWYELADEMGLLVQDEYPVWYGAKAEDFPKTLKAEGLAREYAEWMAERWNHPSVVVWDAQNESVTPETGKAIRMVRHLDLSDRPWDNGYSPPDRATDPIEAHPYVLQNFLGRKPENQGPLLEYLKSPRFPDNGPSELSPPPEGGLYPNPIQNNENVFFWITRGGAPTNLTRHIFRNLYGDQKRDPDFYYRTYAHVYQRIISYWRVMRNSATVQEFAILSHSREAEEGGGFTSDHWVDPERLEFHPHFRECAFSAFHPIGLLIDRWEEWFPPSIEMDLPIRMINDRPSSWKGIVRLQLTPETGGDSTTIFSENFSVAMDPFGAIAVIGRVTTPSRTGCYRLRATHDDGDDQLVHDYFFEVDVNRRWEAPKNSDANRQFVHTEDSGLIELPDQPKTITCLGYDPTRRSNSAPIN